LRGRSLHAGLGGIANRRILATTPDACGTFSIIATARKSLNVLLETISPGKRKKR